jgi:hypothetical protein
MPGVLPCKVSANAPQELQNGFPNGHPFAFHIHYDSDGLVWAKFISPAYFLTPPHLNTHVGNLGTRTHFGIAAIAASLANLTLLLTTTFDLFPLTFNNRLFPILPVCGGA